MSENNIIPIENIQDRIFTIRGLQVMIDSDIAELYEVKTKRINEQVKRNIERFPERYCFQLTKEEKDNVVANCDHLQKLKFSYQLPFVFTEQGASMLSNVLKSEVAIKVSLQIMDAFVDMKRFMNNNANVFNRLDTIEKRQITYQIETDTKINKIFNALESNTPKTNQAIFFDNQFYDAYIFIADLIRTAEKEIILIDNYIDDTVLTLFTKRNKNVKLTIYTQKITEQLKLDIKKHNEQYPTVEVKKLKKSHDRFLVIDSKELYHIGASLKDLGKRWFAVSKFEFGVEELLGRL